MKKHNLMILALVGMTLASCSFSIGISTSSASSASNATFVSHNVADMDRTEIEQTYSDYTENNIYPIDSAPTSGEVKLLIIPVWFTDSYKYIGTSYRENVREDIETAYFGTQEETGWNSVKSFYETESGGELTLTGTVSEWYELSASVSDYAVDSKTAKTSQLVIDAKEWYFENHTDESPLDYDSDGDGYVDAVMLIYAAPDYATWGKDSYSNLWAYCFWIQDTKQMNKKNPGANVFFWASFDFMYDSLNGYQRTGNTYHAGDCSHCNLDCHTYIHEMGHVFGLDDYYDYGENGYAPAGAFSMQDFNVGGHDPYSMMALGWADPYIPTESCAITIGAFQTTHEVILLTPDWNSYNSPFDEYLLLELYTPTGLNELDCNYSYGNAYPKGPKTVGIRLWHVDARLLYMNSDQTVSASRMTTNARYDSYYGVTVAFTNTYGDEDYGSPLGSSYDKYNLLQLIRNDTNVSMLNKNALKSGDLFRNGDTFEFSSYKRQFVRSTTLNSGKALGWSFSVGISGSGESATATINLTKE